MGKTVAIKERVLFPGDMPVNKNIIVLFFFGNKPVTKYLRDLAPSVGCRRRYPAVLCQQAHAGNDTGGNDQGCDGLFRREHEAQRPLHEAESRGGCRNGKKAKGASGRQARRIKQAQKGDDRPVPEVERVADDPQKDEYGVRKEFCVQ